MTKKLTWEVDKTSLVLKVTDGAKETTWRLRKTTTLADTSQMLEDIWLALQGNKTIAELAQELMPPVGAAIHWDGSPMLEEARTVDVEELAELRRYQHNETSEEASRAAQAAAVRQLNIGAKWFEADDDDTYAMPIPDYDSGEVRPR